MFDVISVENSIDQILIHQSIWIKYNTMSTPHALPSAVKLSHQEVAALKELGMKVETTIKLPLGAYFVQKLKTGADGVAKYDHIMADEIASALLRKA